MRECKTFLPNVYKDSYLVPEELERYPYEGEVEMLDQADTVDLNGEVHIDMDMFSAWISASETSEVLYPCASAISRYSIDQQGVDMRGSVDSDTAWELCCRLLLLPTDAKVIGTRGLAQLILYLEDLCVLPTEIRIRHYSGMLEELQQRGKTIVTLEDEEAMKVRWIKQTLHREIDQTRAPRPATDDAVVMDLEIEGAVIEGEQLSIIAETEKEAAKVLKQACAAV